MSNTKPAVDDQTHGTWRRIRLVPFNAKFDGVNRADEKEIYKSLLEEEGPQILRWLVDGCMLQAGRKDLDIPPVVLDATAEYKEEEDVLGDFIQDNFVRSPEGMVSKADAYDALVKWATYRQDARLKKWSRQRFGKRMEESGFRRTKDSKGIHQFKGLDWKPAAETPWRQSGAYTPRPGPHNPPPMGHDWVREYEA
jgi:putative DNA primase/helicase